MLAFFVESSVISNFFRKLLISEGGMKDQLKNRRPAITPQILMISKTSLSKDWFQILLHNSLLVILVKSYSVSLAVRKTSDTIPGWFASCDSTLPPGIRTEWWLEILLLKISFHTCNSMFSFECAYLTQFQISNPLLCLQICSNELGLNRVSYDEKVAIPKISQLKVGVSENAENFSNTEVAVV